MTPDQHTHRHAAPDAPASLVYAGIDEAGYGPRIGPLTVGLSVFRVRSEPRPTPEASRGERIPPTDLWRRLRGVVGRAPDATRAHKPIVYVDDSKRLKGANSLKRRHPLDRLEQGVLAFLRILGHAPADDAGVLRVLGASAELAPWYLGAPTPSPISTTPEHIGVLSSGLRGGLTRVGVAPLALRCALIGEAEFNEIVAEHGSKAVVNFSAAISHLRTVWREFGADAPIVAVDRHGGRVCYGRGLARAFPDATLRVVEESHDRSEYELIERAGRSGSNRRMRVMFEIEADARRLPTALASMIAKLARELTMARLNRYWCGRMPNLAPTAGYGVDAHRWLGEVGPHLTVSDRAMLVRRA